MAENIFSIIIPSWNNLPFLKLCIASIRKNSCFPHQIIVFINDGSDGSLEWVRAQGLEYLQAPENVGVCLAVNHCRSLVRTEYIVYLNDDMYVCPEWDQALWEVMQRLGHKYFYLSGSGLDNQFNPAIPNYGSNPDDFDEAALLKQQANFVIPDWSGASWPPCLVHRDLWDLVGGYSIEFSPGMYSDPDFSLKLYKVGVREFIGVGRSRVYHFGCKTTTRIRRNFGHRQFVMKWGITPKSFYQEFLKMKEPYQGPVPDINLPNVNNLDLSIKWRILSYLLRNAKKKRPSLKYLWQRIWGRIHQG